MCEAAGKPGVRLQSRMGTFGHFCESGHIFSDTTDLLAMKPTRLEPVPLPKSVPTVPMTSIAVQVSDRTAASLRARFPNNLDETMSGIVRSMADDPAFIVPAEDAKRISERANQKVSDSSTLVGIIFALKTEADQALEQARLAKASTGAAGKELPTGEYEVKLHFAQDVYRQFEEKAKFNGMDVPKFMLEMSLHALLNGWV